jgi:hypothetical protein
MLLDGVPHHQIIQKLQQTFGTINANTPAGPESNVVILASADGTSNPGTQSISDSGDHETRNTQYDPISQSDSQSPSQIENQNGRTSLVSKIENLDSLTPHHLTTWKQYGGYRDWLRDRQRVEECKIRHELTVDLARSAEGIASYQAAPKVAVAQICQTIIDLGPEGLKEAMQASPLNCFRLLNALARLINSGLKCEHHIVKHAAETRPKPKNGFTPDVVEQMETQLNMF